MSDPTLSLGCTFFLPEEGRRRNLPGKDSGHMSETLACHSLADFGQLLPLSPTVSPFVKWEQLQRVVTGTAGGVKITMCSHWRSRGQPHTASCSHARRGSPNYSLALCSLSVFLHYTTEHPCRVGGGATDTVQLSVGEAMEHSQVRGVVGCFPLSSSPSI